MNIEFLRGFFKERKIKFKEDYSLENRSYIKINTIAKFAVFIKNPEEARLVIRETTDAGVPSVIVGGLSNTLFSQPVFNGVIVITDEMRGKSRAENEIALDCGVRFGGALHFYANAGLGGAEELFHIPGAVGGLVNSNAGAFGKEISDLLVGAELMRLTDGESRYFSKEEMKLSYRSSILKEKKHFLLRAKFRLKECQRNEIFSKRDYFLNLRRESQPLDYPSLGSIFKRCQGVGAGYYIDRAGLKGLTVGGAQVSEKHAGFIINRGGATARDVLALVDMIKTRVHSIFGITLEEEIEII